MTGGTSDSVIVGGALILSVDEDGVPFSVELFVVLVSLLFHLSRCIFFRWITSVYCDEPSFAMCFRLPVSSMKTGCALEKAK